MTKVGFLKPVIKGNQEELHGEIKTLQTQLKIKLIKNNLKTLGDAPDYLICAIGFTGQDVQIGAAWVKRKSQIGDVEYEFLSITIDDPSLPNPINVAAFKNNEGGWDITWRRRQLSLQTQENQNTA